MTSATVTHGENTLAPLLRDRCLYIENQTSRRNSLNLEQPDFRLFVSDQDHLSRHIRPDDSTQVEIPLKAWVLSGDSIRPRTRLKIATSQRTTDSLGWRTLPPTYNVLSALSPIEESSYIFAHSNDPVDITACLDELRALQDGWHDGFGIAPSSQGLDWLRQHAARYLGDSPTPYIYPTPDGGVQFEWDIGSFSPSLEIDLELHVGEWHCLDLCTDESDERELRLERSQDWQWLVMQLHQLQVRAA